MTANNNKRVVIVTGCSIGIKHETALALAENNIITNVTMGDTKKGSNILNKSQSKYFTIKTTELDIDDTKSVKM